ncbi:MAG: SIMPL domain-containing protein [Flavobacteriales bacterium]
MEFIKKHFAIILISLAVMVTGLILGKSYLSKGKPDPKIKVIGKGEETFDSDLIVWNASFSRNDSDLKVAYSALNVDLQMLRVYLKSKGVSDKDIIIEAANIEKQYSNEVDADGKIISTTFNGYGITQNVKVQSKNVNLIERVSREVSELINAGIELDSKAPEYYYTKMADLKLKMIEKATSDARKRAEKIAENGGGSLGKLHQADMGVFQITAENSSEDYEWGGSFNTSARRKTAHITIRLEYTVN